MTRRIVIPRVAPREITFPAWDATAVLYSCTIDRVIDGDSVNVWRYAATSDTGFAGSYERLRLAHINTSELHSPIPDVRVRAIAALTRLRELAPIDAPAQVWDFGDEKYGRRLAQLNVAGVNVAAQLLAEGLADPYEGGAR